MGDRTEPPLRRPRPAAMKEVGESNDHRQRARAGRGVKFSDQAGPPPRGPRHNFHNRNRRRQSGRQDGPSNPHQPSHDHDDNYQHRSPPSAHRRPEHSDDLTPRFSAPVHRERDFEGRPSRESERTGSPSSKRQRSRSLTRSPGPSHRKKRRELQDPSRFKKHRKSDSARRRHRRKSSPNRHSPRPHASPSRFGDASHTSRRDSNIQSPRNLEGEGIADRADYPYSAPDRASSQDRRASSPVSDTRHVFGHLDTSSAEGHHHKPPSVATESHHTLDGDYRSDVGDRPTNSPPVHPDRKRRNDVPRPQSGSHSATTEEMGPRGSFGKGRQPLYSQKHQYHGDSRGYPPSPQRTGVYHDSPPQASYPPSRGSWGGPYSPPQYSHYSQGPGGYGPPTGPSGYYHSNPPRSPSYGGPPPPGNYRGGHRGNGPRGGGSYQNRNHRGQNHKNGNVDSSNQGNPSRGYYPPDDMNVDEQLHMEEGPANGDADANGDAYQSQDVEDEPVSQGDNMENAPRGPSGRPPPTGPSRQGNSSGKFSFAFKASSKPAATAPKPEISQKFNAAPQRNKEPPLTPSQQDRAPPRFAPTEPASARQRPDARNPPDGPRITPRTRKVKKMVRKPKPRPTLPPELAVSESVFFRKPGNESVIGSGTYGKVFKGVNVYTKGLVALKKIRMEGERDGFPVTAVREIKLLQSLRHTNIVNLQEVMVEKNDCFMVFEYLSHDLTGLLNHPSFKLESAQKKHLAKQLFEGLDYLHTRGVLHRDIKAANILVSNEGVLKLADFGLARFYAKHHQLDYTNRVITIWYRSPELLLGETQYTAAVDVWSAACVMVEIFTRHAIFAGDGTELSQLDKIYNILGTPSRQEWPGLVDMAWFELLKPTARRNNVFAEKYQDRVTTAAFDLLSAMFQYDPVKRPTAAEVLQHAYFTDEEPLPRQAIELSEIDGDWHEFESKALRKENERRDREARKASRESASGPSARPKERKRAHDSVDHPRDHKRVHVDATIKEAETKAETKADPVQNQAQPPVPKSEVEGSR